MKPSRRGVTANIAGTLMCLAIAALVLMTAVKKITTAHHLDIYGVAADGSVESIKKMIGRGDDPDNDWSKVTVVFVDAQGRQIHARYNAPEDGGGAVVHTPIHIRYDPQDPTVIKPVGLRHISGGEDGVMLLLFCGLPMVGLSGCAIQRLHRQLHPLKSSSRVPGRCLLELRSPGIAAMVVFSPDGTRLATAGPNQTKLRHGPADHDSSAIGSVHLWDATTGQQLFAMDPAVPASMVVFSPDGTRLATADTNSEPKRTHRTVDVWDATTGQHLFAVEHPQIQTLTFAPDGRHLVTSSRDQVRVFDSTGTLLSQIGTPNTKPMTVGVVFRPELQRWTATPRLVQVTDTAGRVVLSIRHRSLAVSSPANVAFSPDGTRLATTQGGRKTTIWDTTTGAHLLTLQSRPGSGKPNMVMFSPDGTYLAGTCTDNAARLYDAVTGEQLLRLWHPGPLNVTAVAFNPEGTRLATTGADQITRIWELPRSKQVNPEHRFHGG